MADLNTLYQMKNRIEEAKTKRSKWEGRRDALLDQLKTKFRSSSATAAEKEFQKLKKDLDRMDREITRRIEKLKEDFDV